MQIATDTIDDGDSVADRVTSHDPSVVPYIHQHLPQLGLDASKRDVSNSEWGILTQMFSMVRVERAVPGNMMNTIESFASKLTSDIMEGKETLSPDRLESIGSEVLGNLNPSDLQQMTENLSELLPALGAMSSAASMNGAPPDLADTMAQAMELANGLTRK